MNSVLRTINLEKHYGGVHALRNVNFDISPGEVHAICGENGAGKSTLSKIIAGAVQPDSGQIILDDRAVVINSPMEAQRLGISIIYQELDLFPNLTIGENMVVRNLKSGERRFVSKRSMESFCRPFLDQVGLGCRLDQSLGELNIGNMQLVAIARALSMDSRIIFMDEPTSSLADDAVSRLFGLIRRLSAQGVSIVYISHKMKEIFDIADRITVMRDGQYIGTKQTAETNVDEIISMMVGRWLSERTITRSGKTDNVLLKVRGLTTRKISDISFDLHSGEVLGIAGLVGAGRSELGAAMFGLDRLQSGSIEMEGRIITPRSPREAIRAGIGFLPEDRKLQGLNMSMSVRHNATMAILDRIHSAGFIQRKCEIEGSDKVFHQTNVKAASPDMAVNALSGGNQQKVLLAKWLLTDPKVIFMDDPTRGIDVGAKSDIYSIIEDLAAAGRGVVLVSSELPELLRCCDRIMVLHEGRCTGVVDASSATQELIMAMATSTNNNQSMEK